MEVKKEIDHDRFVYKVTTTTKSNQLISIFYPVNDVVETFMDINNLYPYRFHSKQKEGTYTGDKEIIFDREKNIAIFINHKKGGEESISEVPAAVHDPLSVVYFFRTIPFNIGKDVNIDVYDGKKNWTLVIQVLKKEKLWTPVGTFDTIRVKALIKYEGLFVNRGDVQVWFTEDSSHMPVKMESKISIGHITAILIERQN